MRPMAIGALDVISSPFAFLASFGTQFVCPLRRSGRQWPFKSMSLEIMRPRSEVARGLVVFGLGGMFR